jgi:hypothetical protein
MLAIIIAIVVVLMILIIAAVVVSTSGKGDTGGYTGGYTGGTGGAGGTGGTGGTGTGGTGGTGETTTSPAFIKGLPRQYTLQNQGTQGYLSVDNVGWLRPTPAGPAGSFWRVEKSDTYDKDGSVVFVNSYNGVGRLGLCNGCNAIAGWSVDVHDSTNSSVFNKWIPEMSGAFVRFKNLYNGMYLGACSGCTGNPQGWSVDTRAYTASAPWNLWFVNPT